MGIFDRFRDKDEPEFDPFKDLVLERMKVGYFVDYDLKTWQVTAFHRYDYGEGERGEEWELSDGREKIYLERIHDDDDEWTVSRKLPIGEIGSKVTRHIIEHEDPPDMIVVREKPYHLDESGSAYFYQNGRGEGVGFISWTFTDEVDESFITIEQWGEEAFEACAGSSVEAYEFSNILPGE